MADKRDRGRAAAAQRIAPRRPGFFRRSSRYLGEVRQELNRTQWPGRRELINATQVVLGVLVAVGLYMWVIDVILTQILRRGLGLGN